MKTKNLLLTGLISLGMLTACSNDDELGTAGNQDGENGTAYMQLAITIANDNTTMTRSDLPEGDTGSTEFGTADEYTINTLQVIGVNSSDDKIAWIKDATLEEAINNDDNDSRMKRATAPFDVKNGSYRIYVIANPTEGVKYTESNIGQSIATLDISNVDLTGDEHKNFIMTNFSTPGITTVSTSSPTVTEFNDDGSEKTSGNPQQVIKVDVAIQRAAAKIQFATAENFTTGSDFQSATIEGVYIANQNKKMNLVMDDQTVTAPTSVTTTWYYPEDPNYNTKLSGNDFTNNFSNSIYALQQTGSTFPTFTPYTGTGATDIYYVPENTMSGNAIQTGQTTGVIYKTTITIKSDSYTSLLATNGSGDYDDMFEKVNNYVTTEQPTGAPTNFDQIFETAEDQNGTFYAYNKHIFKSRKAAALYQAIAESSSTETGENLYTAFTTNDSDDNKLIKKYENGESYYFVGIKHNPTLTEANVDYKYGVVRNHWYVLTVSAISDLGYTKSEIQDPTVINPTDPVDPVDKEIGIQVMATIKKWTVVKQSVDLN